MQNHKAPDGREWVSIHPDNAGRLGIADGDLVRLFNGRGACLARARYTTGLHPQVLVLPTGAWLAQKEESGLDIAGNPNVLTLDIGSSAFGQGCAAHTCLVSIEKYHTSENTQAEPRVEFSPPRTIHLTST